MQDNRGLTEHPWANILPMIRSMRGVSGLVLALAAVILMAGGGTAWWTWNRIASEPGRPTNTLEEPSQSTASEFSPETPQEAAQEIPATTSSTPPTTGDSADVVPVTVSTVTVYLLDVGNVGLERVPVTLDVKSAEAPAAVLTTAFEQLLQGTVKSDNSDSLAFSEIPAETALLSLNVKADGVHVDLSGEFEQGGGSASMVGRLTQVIYTATSLDPAQPVWLSVEGESLERLGGEGIEVTQPMTRSDVDAGFPL